MPSKRHKRKETSIFFSSDHHYLGLFVVLILSFVAFAFLSPVEFGGDITGFQVFHLVKTNPQIAALSFFVLLFGVSFFVLATFRLLSRVL